LCTPRLTSTPDLNVPNSCCAFSISWVMGTQRAKSRPVSGTPETR
jgi:hypothetical protein